MIAIGNSMSKANYERTQRNIETVLALGASDAILLVGDPVFPHSRREVLNEMARAFKGTIVPVKEGLCVPTGGVAR
jgi:hypothetical protein